MIKAVVFDVYGTLVSTGTGSVDASAKILEKNGSTLSPKVFYADWKAWHRKHIDSLTSFVPEETIFLWDLEKLYAQYGLPGNAREDVCIMLDTLGRRTAFPESKSVVDALKEQFTVCIGSTTDGEPLMHDLARNGITVDHIFTSQILRAYKPHPTFYKPILAALNLPPEDILFVGDSLNDDVFGPQQVGMKTCWVNRNQAVSGSVVPNYEVRDLTDLPALLSAK